MKSTFSKSLGIAAIILLAGAAIVFANGWHGYGGHMRGYAMNDCGAGYGMHAGMMGRGAGPANLSAEDAAKLQQARQKFFDDTRQLRDQIDEKRDAMQDEMAKQQPDAAKVSQLQKDLSALQGEFDQKAVAHRLEVRQILPEQAWGRGGGRGHGPGWGGGYGPCRQ